MRAVAFAALGAAVTVAVAVVADVRVAALGCNTGISFLVISALMVMVVVVAAGSKRKRQCEYHKSG